MKKLISYKERKKQEQKRKLFLSLLLFLLILILSLIVFDSNAQTALTIDSTGLPGDHFNLNAATDLFKNSESPEDFEKKLNTKSFGVNNLDLNEDKRTDYIKVIDCTEKGVHALVLRVDIDEKESQDIAVFEIEKTTINRARLQVVGSSEIYGKQKIVEPEVEKEKFEDELWEGNLKNENGPREVDEVENNVDVYCNVWYWPCVQFMYSPTYMVWISPYYWNYYPMWWDPWMPFSWHMYYQTCLPYGIYYREVYVHQNQHSHNVYLPHKQTSGFISKNYERKREYYIKRENERLTLPEKSKLNKEPNQQIENKRKNIQNKMPDRTIQPRNEKPKNDAPRRRKK